MVKPCSTLTDICVTTVPLTVSVNCGLRGEKLDALSRPTLRPDHYTPTHTASIAAVEDPQARRIIEGIDVNAKEFGVHYFPWGDARQGIAHVVGPEQGITLPGLTMVCGDSHTSTHGALGCIAFGIGASEVAHVLATQVLWQRKPKTMRINVTGTLGFGVTGKDLILGVIRQIGADGGTGYAIEYAGTAVEAMSMEGRMTVCNMTIEAGSRFGLILDAKTIEYIEGRNYAPEGEKWERAKAFWASLPSDTGATFDREVTVDGDALAPMVTWGNSPQDAVQVTSRYLTLVKKPMMIVAQRCWRPSTTWDSRLASLSRAWRWTKCLSARALTVVSKTCAQLRL